jgi:outer membrane protein assembly factor BamB
VARISHLTPAISDGRIVFVDRDRIICLALGDGKQLWKTDRPAFKEHKMRYEIRITDMCTLVAHGDRFYLAQVEPDRKIDWRRTRASLHAFDAATGERLWGRAVAEWGWAHPTDIFCHSGLVWAHDYAEPLVVGLDPDTGEVKRKCSNEKAFGNGHHHRCYRNKATERFMFTGYRGTELIDWDRGTVSLNHWVRSTCRMGVMPCNGLLYAGPHPCDCYIQSKLKGFVALAPRAAEEAVSNKKDRLERGPAFDRQANLKTGRQDWPTYRHDAQRSGFATCELPAKIEPLWEADLGARPLACTIAGGSVFVASAANSVCALGANDGKIRWTAHAAGIVDTPPTIHEGLALFGSADGHVYCVDAKDGQLAWRFRAAPRDRRIIAYGRLESAWPVHGSVLVSDGRALVVAGRSSFLDGGLFAYALDPKTGKVIEEKTVCTPHDIEVNWGRNQKVFTGAKSDILVAAGNGVYMRQVLLFGKEPAGQSRHIRTTAGFLDESWFNRTNWFLGYEPCGELLIASGDRAFGIKKFEKMNPNTAFFTPGEKGYEMYCSDPADRPPAKPPMNPRKKRPPAKVGPTGRPSTGSNTRFEKPGKRLWQVRVPVRVIAMVRTGRTLFAAGTPDVLEEKDPYAAYEGRRGGVLLAVSVSAGKILGKYELESAPVYDGMAAAGGRLYISTVDGKVRCFGPR